jgi:hypothetical protein
MARSSGVVHAAALFSAAAGLLVSACGDDAAPDEASAGSGGAQVGGSTSGKSGSDTHPEAGAVSNEAGGSSSPGAAGESTTPGGGTGNGPADNGSSGAPAAGATGIDTPGPAPGGGSVYAVECSGETAMCGVEGAHCLGITLDTGDKGYSCSNRCNSVSDCSDAPSGAEAEAGCIQFKAEKRCVLVCYNQPNEYACPDGMSCYIYPNSPIGYCLWTQ